MHLRTYTHTSIDISIDICIERRTFILKVQALQSANGSDTLVFPVEMLFGEGMLLRISRWYCILQLGYASFIQSWNIVYYLSIFHVSWTSCNLWPWGY